MHFFYIDESGCTGEDITFADQPIFVLGGVGLRDEGWNKTQTEWNKILTAYFNGELPNHFELHAHELLSPNGEGPFENHNIEMRLGLVRSAIDLILERSHSIHLFAIKKDSISNCCCESELPFNCSVPYLCAYDYLITYLNDHVKNKLGSTARGMVIFDKKEQFHTAIEKITRNRRFDGPKTHRVKWIVEFSYAVDSQKNPMVQLSDLVVLCTRRFLEIEHGFRDQWPSIVKNFYAECYSKIHGRIAKKAIVERKGRGLDSLNAYLKDIRCEPRRTWKKYYEFSDS
jgi:hypothetical protein